MTREQPVTTEAPKPHNGAAQIKALSQSGYTFPSSPSVPPRQRRPEPGEDRGHSNTAAAGGGHSA